MSKLLARYRANYGIPETEPLSERQVLAHLALELQLTEELRDSSPDHRWETFERCYGRLYSEAPWLNRSEPPPDPANGWPQLLGSPPRRILEVGSGEGELARALAERGYEVEATDVTRERGRDRNRPVGRVSWGTTDGVHLDAFAEASSFDGVISDQVVEHLHPDDIGEHFRSASRVLRRGGVCAFRTPHAYSGPHDVSCVFGLDRPVGMHLHEYTYGELASLLRRSGFDRVAGVLSAPGPIRRRLGLSVRASERYLGYLLFVERCLAWLPSRVRRVVARALPPPLFRRDVWIVAGRT